MAPMLRVLLMAGGRGSRLWPVSGAVPKPLLRLLPGGQSFLEATAARLEPLAPPSNWVLGTGAADHEALATGLSEAGCGEVSSIVEPGPRDTAPAVLYSVAALRAGAFGAGPDDLVLATPLDHHMERPEAFRAAVERGMPLAGEGRLVTFGITPAGPATGYGYLERGASLGEGADEVAAFREKPDAAKAEEYVAAGHLWNSGVFLFQVGALAKAAAAAAPDLWRGVMATLGAAADATRPGSGFLNLERVSFDYAIAERHPSVATVACDPGWRDLGTWDEVARLWDEAGEQGLAEALVELAGAGNVAYAPGRPVAFVGVDGLVVVDGPDGVLVCRREAAQAVREVAERLRGEGST